MEIPFLGKFGSKNQNCQLKLKFGTYTNSNMQNSMVMFIYFVFDWKYPFWANLVQKIKIISWSWNLVPGLIQICRIQWCCSRYFFFEWKDCLWVNLVQKVEIFGWNWNLVPALIQICWIQQWCSLFRLRVEISFLGKFGTKNQKYQFKMKFAQWSSPLFLFFIENTLFGQIWSKKSNLYV